MQQHLPVNTFPMSSQILFKKPNVLLFHPYLSLIIQILKFTQKQFIYTLNFKNIWEAEDFHERIKLLPVLCPAGAQEELFYMSFRRHGHSLMKKAEWLQINWTKRSTPEVVVSLFPPFVLTLFLGNYGLLGQSTLWCLCGMFDFCWIESEYSGSRHDGPADIRTLNNRTHQNLLEQLPLLC